MEDDEKKPKEENKDENLLIMSNVHIRSYSDKTVVVLIPDF